MKPALAASAILALVTLASGPAGAFDRFSGVPGYAFNAGDRDWGGDDGWREHRDWRRQRWNDDGALTESQVAHRLMRQGFVRIEDIDRRRDRYIVRAVRPNGALIRLAVDAYDGDVVARERIGWVADGRGYDRSDRRPASGIEFDLGGGTLGIYSR